MSPSTVRDYAEKYSDNVDRVYTGAHQFIKQIIKAAVHSGTRSAKRARDHAEYAKRELPEVAKSAEIRGFYTYSTYNLLILQDKDTKETYLFTDIDIDRIVKLWNGLGLFDTYLSNYGAGNPTDKRHHELLRSCETLRDHLLKLMGATNQESANTLCRKLDIYHYYLLSKQARDINDKAYILQFSKLRKEDSSDFID